MEVLGFADARARFGAVMKAVAADHNPVAIARPGGGAVVLVSLSDWRAMESALSASQAHEQDGDQPANL